MVDLKREYLLNRMIIEIFDKNFLDISSKFLKGKLIDIGCGIKPYKKVLEPFVTEHVGVDHEDTTHDKSKIDYFGTAYNIPVDSNSFDSAICTAVLEHLEEPELAIRECFRILKPGAFAIYSVPFMWHVHEAPRDFYRYSRYGLKYLFEKAGFEVIEIRPLSGFLVTFMQLHLYIINGKFNKGIIRHLRILDAYTWICNSIGLKLNRFDKSYDWTWMYIAVVKKVN
jgi:SAM-dependent methyltransferase